MRIRAESADTCELFQKQQMPINPFASLTAPAADEIENCSDWGRDTVNQS